MQTPDQQTPSQPPQSSSALDPKPVADANGARELAAPDVGAAPHLHVALNVRNLRRSIDFYRTLFEREPDKVRPHYARFTVPSPPLVLSLNVVETVGTGGRVAHLGLRLGTGASYRGLAARLAAAGIALREEREVLCCHAVENKVWARDPEGNEWELYELVDDAPEESGRRPQGTCGDPGNDPGGDPGAASGGCC